MLSGRLFEPLGGVGGGACSCLGEALSAPPPPPAPIFSCVGSGAGGGIGHGVGECDGWQVLIKFRPRTIVRWRNWSESRDDALQLTLTGDYMAPHDMS